MANPNRDETALLRQRLNFVLPFLTSRVPTDEAVEGSPVSMHLDELNLLLVEPSSAQQMILEGYLKELGVLGVRKVASVEQALIQARAYTPHVVLSAMHLKDGKGSDLMLALREDEDLQDTAFLLISSETRTQELEPVRQGGAIAIIKKPCTQGDLMQALSDTTDYLSDNSIELDTQDIEDLRVLVVDDSRTSRRFIKNVLTTLGIEHMTEAVDGVEGTERMQESFFDLVVTDYNMPRMDGYQFLEHIRSESNQPTIPVLMVTSEKSGARIAGVERAGVSAIVDKPFELEKVRQILMNILE